MSILERPTILILDAPPTPGAPERETLLERGIEAEWAEWEATDPAGRGEVLARADMNFAGDIIISGSGSSNDANHLTGPSRDGSGLALAIRRALARSAIGPESIDLIHLHGTGTLYNDAMESLAVRSVFGAAPPPVCSSKVLAMKKPSPMPSCLPSLAAGGSISVSPTA